MTSQLQVLNKVLQTKDFSLIELNNLTEDFFFNYKAEFNYIKNHYEKYQSVPDKLTFISIFPEFDIIEVTEPDNYLIEQLYKDYNSSFIASRFNQIKKLIEEDKTDEAMAYLVNSVDNLHQGSAIQSHDLLNDTSRYDHYLERVANHDKYYIRTGFPELDNIIGGLDRENENMVIAARTGIGEYRPRKLGLENEDKCNVLYSLKDYAFLKNKKVVIFGGGDSALDWAKQLSEISDVTLVHRRDEFRGNAETIKDCDIKIYLSYVPESMTENKIKIKSVKSDPAIELDYDYVLVNFGQVIAKTEFESLNNVYYIGDSTGTRTIADGIRQANEAFMKVIYANC